MKKRLLQMADYLGVSVRSFESACGLQRGNISNMSDDSAIGSDKLAKIIDGFPQINPSWLLTGRGSMLRSQPVSFDDNSASVLSDPQTGYGSKKTTTGLPAIDVPESKMSIYRLKTDYFVQGKQPIPLYEIEASAGLNAIFDSQVQQVPLDYISVPNAPNCDGALYVRGDSMYPVLKAGDIVCYKTIHNIENMVFGEMYLLDIDNGDDRLLAIKYVQKSDRGNKYIRLVSENRHHADRDEPVKNIKAIAHVKLSIRYNTIS